MKKILKTQKAKQKGGGKYEQNIYFFMIMIKVFMINFRILHFDITKKLQKNKETNEIDLHEKHLAIEEKKLPKCYVMLNK